MGTLSTTFKPLAMTSFSPDDKPRPGCCNCTSACECACGLESFTVQIKANGWYNPEAEKSRAVLTACLCCCCCCSMDLYVWGKYSQQAHGDVQRRLLILRIKEGEKVLKRWNWKGVGIEYIKKAYPRGAELETEVNRRDEGKGLWVQQ